MANPTPFQLPTNAEGWHTIFAESGENYFFGREPSSLARTAVTFWKAKYGEERTTVLDLGCGEGRDAVYYAKEGFEVLAVDGAASAIAKTEQLAQEANLSFSCQLIDVLDFALPESLPLFHANNCLQFLGSLCPSYLRECQRRTPVGGFHVVSSFTTQHVEPREGIYRFAPNELKEFYADWKVLYYAEDMIWREHSQKYYSFAQIVTLRS